MTRVWIIVGFSFSSLVFTTYSIQIKRHSTFLTHLFSVANPYNMPWSKHLILKSTGNHRNSMIPGSGFPLDDQTPRPGARLLVPKGRLAGSARQPRGSVPWPKALAATPWEVAFLTARSRQCWGKFWKFGVWPILL